LGLKLLLGIGTLSMSFGYFSSQQFMCGVGNFYSFDRDWFGERHTLTTCS
jgi:hypothetical protein